MKRFFALAALLLGLAACQTEPEGLDVNVGGAVDTTITVAIPEGTRASSADGFDLSTLANTDYSLRYILEIYRVDDSNGTCQRHVLVSDNKSVAFPVRLVPGYDYNVVVWADIVKGNSEDDRYYNTENGLDAITIIDDKWNAMDETRDAYTATMTYDDFEVADLNETISLTRPFAKLRVVATDIKDIRAVGLEPTAATVTYSQDMNMYRTFDARTGEASNASTKSHNITYSTSPYTDANGEFTLFADYFFVNEGDTAQFELNVYADEAKSKLIKNNNFNTEIFVERNKLTTIKGDVLTVGGNVKVEIENDGKLEAINYADNAETLQEIIKEAPAGEQTNITLGGDIDLGDLFGASIHSTRAAATLPIVIPEGKVVVLDLNGYKITTPYAEGSTTNHLYAFENHGSLTIQDSKGNGQIIARGIFNYGTMTLESGKINACDHNGGYGVRNYEGSFTMNGGTIVASNENGDDRVAGNYDASPLRVDEGATATINGGNITNTSNYTVAIDNYGTTTINGGNITSVHSTVSNSGTMTIKGDATTIKCEGEYTSAHPIYAHGEASVTTIENGNIIGNDKASCYYVAVENNPKVYIYGGEFTNAGQAAFTGEGTIVVTGGQFDKDPSERVAEGYKAVEQNGIYTIAKDPAAMIGSEEYLSLQAAIEAVQDGETIVLQRDVNIATPAYGQNALNHAKAVNFTLDLNGKTITADTGNSVFRYNISQTNATSDITVTFKNGTITSGDKTWCTVMAAGTSDDVKAIFNLENLTINASKAGDLAIKAWDYAVINATNVTVNATKCAGGFYAVGGEIVLDNCTVNQKGLWTAPYLSMAVAVSNGGKATVNSGNYTTEPTAASEGYNQGTSHGSWCAGVMNSGGELIINGGTFANGNFGDDALATHARGLIFGDTASKIVINDGTFNALKTVIDYQNNLGVQPNPNIVINGGNFSANPAVVTSYGGVVLAEGKVAAQGADGRWTLVDGVMDEAGLKAAFEKGGNIVLGADITISETVTLAEGKTAVLDLNGKTLSAVDMNTIKNNGGNLTIKNGTVTRTGDVVGYSVNNASGEITVENATIKRGLYTSGSKMTATNANISHEQSSRHAIYAWNCAVTINSGNFHNDNAGNATLMASGSSIVTINGGTFSIADGRSTLGWTSSMIDQNSTAQVIVKGGLFNGGFRINSADTTLTIEGGEFNTNNGSAFTDSNGTKVVKGGKFTDAGAQNWAKKYIAEGYEMNANGEVVAK